MLDGVRTALLAMVVMPGLGVISGWRHHKDMNAALSLNRMVFIYAMPLGLFPGTVVAPPADRLRRTCGASPLPLVRPEEN
jgi:hypothetical protein